MILQSLYHELCAPLDSKNLEECEMRSFLVPYVLVIHRPSRRGFYLDREYRHIIDVSKAIAPVEVTEFEENHLCACSNIPQWALAERSEEFTTYWLY